MYDYVRQRYGVDPKLGQRARHTVTGKSGVVAREKPGVGHYVQIKFDGQKFALPCHPDELEFQPAAQTAG